MKKLLPFLMVFLAACQSKPASTIVLYINQKSVQVKGIQATELYGLKTDSLNRQAWQSLFPVYKMPADTDLRNYQRPVWGKYSLVNDVISFTPDTPFVKDSIYFARYYRFADGLNGGNMVIDKRKPGETPYTELIFKY